MDKLTFFDNFLELMDLFLVTVFGCIAIGFLTTSFISWVGNIYTLPPFLVSLVTIAISHYKMILFWGVCYLTIHIFVKTILFLTLHSARQERKEKLFKRLFGIQDFSK